MGLLDKVKDVANKATEQAKHGIAVGKEKVEDVRLRKQVQELLAEIGDLVVSQRRGTAPADADAQIDAKIASITELEAQIEANAAADAADASAEGDATSGDATPEDCAPGS
jgi:hypothetical protein